MLLCDRKFSEKTVNEVFTKVRDAIIGLEENPDLGRSIPGLESLGLDNYRYMFVEKKNKIIFEIVEPEKAIFITLLCQDRDDFDAVLTKRLLAL